MVLVKRQTSNPGSCTVNYGGFDSPKAASKGGMKSERSFFHDLEGKTKIPEFITSRESFKKYSKSKRTISARFAFRVLQYVVFGYVVMRTWRANTLLAKTNDELSVMNDEYQSLQELLKDTETELRHAHDDFLKLQVRVNTITPHVDIKKGVKNSDDRKVLTDTILDRHDAQAERIKALQQTIQDTQKADLIKT